eukprot:5489674-Prymnesium_polylepis.1
MKKVRPNAQKQPCWRTDQSGMVASLAGFGTTGSSMLTPLRAPGPGSYVGPAPQTTDGPCAQSADDRLSTTRPVHHTLFTPSSPSLSWRVQEIRDPWLPPVTIFRGSDPFRPRLS